MQMIIIFMESAVSDQLLNASASPYHDSDAGFEHEYTEGDDAETLAVWAFRRWILGLRYQAAEQWETVRRGLQRRCGEAAGREATAAMAEMIEELRRTAKRTITHHQPCCSCIGDDEATLLVLLAACQRGDVLLAQTAAQMLSGALHADTLVLAAMRFAEALTERGLMFPYRDLPQVAAPPPAASIH
jgi:hypothetical protein